MFSVPASVEVPELMKRRRGLEDFRSSGMNVEVMMCVPVVLTFQLAFHISRWLSLPAATSRSNWAPRW